MRPVLVLFVAVALLGAVAQATYWGAPNVRACPLPISCNSNATSYPAGYTTDGCSSRSYNIYTGDPPHNRSGSDIAVTRLTVPAGTVFQIKQIQLVYTYRFTTYTAWNLHPNGLNLTLSLWNTTQDQPYRPADWNSPLINDQRTYFNRSSAETWGYAYGMYANLSNTITLSAGSYLWGLAGYSGAIPSTSSLDLNFIWLQNNDIDPFYDAGDDIVIYIGSSLTRNSQYGLPLTGLANATNVVTSYPGRMCAWFVGALTNLTDGTVDDPTLASLANQAGYVVRFPLKSNVLNVNLTNFVESMNAALNVGNISPYASVQIYTLQRQWEFGYIDWYVNTAYGYTAMQQGLSLSNSQIYAITGLTMNGFAQSVTVAARDT